MSSEATIYTISLDGNVPSKKNRNRFNRKTGRVFKDKKFRDWHVQAMEQWAAAASTAPIFNHVKSVTIDCTFESRRRKDLTNVAESVMDLLVDCEILEDDNFFVAPRIILEGRYMKGVSKTVVTIEL